MPELNSAIARPPWAIFCIYGPPHIDHLQRVLLPALRREIVDGAVPPVYLLNYFDNNALLHDTIRDNHVHDLSAARPVRRFGFGESANFLFEAVRPERGFFLINPDCVPFPGCLDRLREVYEHATNAGIVEARQWPLEHPKEYEAATGETPWSSCACCLLPSIPFANIGGFDPIYFLYNEDVDLSWRLRLAGHRAIYVPDAFTAHYTGFYSYRGDRFYPEHYYSIRNFLVLSYKFYGEKGEHQAIDLLKASRYPITFQEMIVSAYKKLKPTIRRYTESVDPLRFKITGLNLYHDLRYHP